LIYLNTHQSTLLAASASQLHNMASFSLGAYNDDVFCQDQAMPLAGIPTLASLTGGSSLAFPVSHQQQPIDYRRCGPFQ
jgi:hypothetical protein